MTRVTVAPGLVLDDEMFELTRTTLAVRAPDQLNRFTWKRFTARESWLLVPDVNRHELDGLWFKAEFVVKHGKPYHQTIKLNVWRFPDRRRHNHPWPFVGCILLGGYAEDRYEVTRRARDRILVDPSQKWAVEGVSVLSGVQHLAGTFNDLPLTTFHEVTEIFEPGRTFTLMDCNFGRKDGWGHLEEDGRGKFVYVPNKMGTLDAKFKSMKLDLNPHLRQ